MGETRRQPERIRRKQPKGVRRERSHKGRYRAAWSPESSLTKPHYEQLSEAPADLVERALRGKYPWVRRFVEESCPRGKIKVYARAYAEAQGIPEEDIPPYTTLNRWAHQLQTYGRVGLVDKARSDAGTSRALTPEQERLIQIGMLGGKQGYEAARTFAARKSRAGVPVPTYATARRAAKRIEQRDPHLVAIARHGIAWYRNHYQMSIAQDFVPGGFRLEVDSTVADIWVRIPDASKPGGWDSVRVALTVVQDAGTRMLVTFNCSLHAIDSNIMRGVFRRVVHQERNYPGLLSTGVPYQVALDRGSEHRGLFRETLERLGIEVLVGGDNDPQGRARVERLIGTINREVFGNLPGYSPTHRRFNPHAPAENDAKRNLSQLRYEPYRLELPIQGLRTLSQLEAELLGWATLYNERSHPNLSTESPAIMRMIATAKHLDGIHNPVTEAA